MSSQQTRTPSDRSPAGAEPEIHWSEDTDFQWRAGKQVRKSRALAAGSAGRRPENSISRQRVRTLVIDTSKAGVARGVVGAALGCPGGRCCCC